MASGVGIGASFVFDQRPGGAGGGFVVDKAFVFDGVDEYIAFQNSRQTTKNLQPEQAEVLSNNYTVSFWVKSSDFASQPLWGNNNVGPNANAYCGLSVTTHSSGRLVITYGNGTGGGSANRKSGLSELTLTNNQWNQVVVTFNSNLTTPSALCWIDGVPSAVSFTSNPFGQTFNPGTASGSIVYRDTGVASDVPRAGAVGVNRNGGVYYAGEMTEIVTWMAPFTDSAAVDYYNAGTPIDPTVDEGNYNLSADLQGYWTTRDNPTWKQNWYAWKEHSDVALESNYALAFNPPPIGVPGGTVYKLGNGVGNEDNIGIYFNDFTITGWILPISGFPIKNIINAHDLRGLSQAGGWEVYAINSTELIFKVYYSGVLANSASATIVPNEWNFFRVSYKIDADLASMYLEIQTGTYGGSLSAVTSTPPTSQMDRLNAPYPVNIGQTREVGSTEQYQGWIDEIAVYNAVMDSASTLELFNRTKSPSTIANGCTAWWRFGDGNDYPDSAYSNNWKLESAISSNLGDVVTQAGDQITTEGGDDVVLEAGASASILVDMIGSNTQYYDEINRDQSTLPMVAGGLSGTVNTTSESSGNAFTINMEEGDLAPATIP